LTDREASVHFRTLFISDVHIGTRGCQAEALLDFLKHYDAQTIFLAGDIVDGWRLKSVWHWPPLHNVICATRDRSLPRARLPIAPRARAPARLVSFLPAVMPSPGTVGFSTLRVRSYVFRLPLFTRIVIGAIALFWVLSLQPVWDVRAWGALAPSKIGFGTVYRLNTFPFTHINFFHALVNILALTPLLERFESEYGTLNSLAMFLGPFSTFPALLYMLVEKVILRMDTPVAGASIWVFLLLGMEAVRTYRVNPYLEIGTHQVPTWISPLIVVLVVSALIPNTSLLGHLCGLGIGYLCGLGCVQYLAPPEKALRWIEGKLNLLGRLPHYVGVDQKTYGRFGVLPTTAGSSGSGVPMDLVGSTQRLGP